MIVSRIFLLETLFLCIALSRHTCYGSSQIFKSLQVLRGGSEDTAVELVEEGLEGNATMKELDIDEEEDSEISSDEEEEEISTKDIPSDVNATDLRLKGKEAHDDGDFLLAAKYFGEAADALSESEDPSEVEDCATCRLHQALCYLKCEDYDACIESCNDVLDGSVSHTPAARARAHHRRAKSKLALGDSAGALQDARDAAFLGDGKAVRLYGKLMRETSPSPGDFSEQMASLESLLSPPSSSSDSSGTALFESLLSKSGSADSGTSGLMGSLLNGMGAESSSEGSRQNMFSNLKDGSMGNSLAKSVVKSLSKRLDDEGTHDAISNFLQSTSKEQLSQYATMAGMELDDSNLEKIESFCHGVTSKTVRRTVSFGKIAVYIVRVIRRIMKLLRKYRTLFIVLAILQWTKSAIYRPIAPPKVKSKQAAKAGKKAAKAAPMKSEPKK